MEQALGVSLSDNQEQCGRSKRTGECRVAARRESFLPVVGACYAGYDATMRLSETNSESRDADGSKRSVSGN
jgi:hypothetical protein